MRKSLLSLAVAFLALPAFAQTSGLNCDFSNGIPSDFTLYDLDAKEPSIDAKNVGFAVGTPWVALTLADGEQVAASTSWYKTGSTSDDWMVTPAINIPGSRAVLRWRAMASDKEYRDGYSVYVSETATTPEEFKALEPLFTVAKEANAWTSHEVSLAEFAGKQVRVAFVNNSKDKAFLYVDDLFLDVPPTLEVISQMPRVVSGVAGMPVMVQIANTSENDINGCSLDYEFGDGTTYTYTTDEIIPAGGAIELSFNSEAFVPRNETVNYTFTITNGDEVSTVSGKVSNFHRCLVAEEVTGTWCGYCVRGIAAMKQMKEDHPGEFIGIAVHKSSVNWTDPMDYAEYTDYLFSKMSMAGYPHMTMNRLINFTGDPGNMETYYANAYKRPYWVGIGLGVDFDEATGKITANADVYSAKEFSGIDYRLAYVLIENDVHNGEQPVDEAGNVLGNGWEQMNYYAGGSMGPCGGFENMGSYVMGWEMWYQDVARYINEGFEGIEESKITGIAEGGMASHSHTFTLPESVMDANNAEVVAMLIDTKTGEILNAAITPLIAKTESVEDITTPTEMRVAVAGSVISVAGAETLNVYAIDGTLLARGTDSVDLDGRKGICLVEAVNGTQRIIKKIIL